jgi:hypothetical protein
VWSLLATGETVNQVWYAIPLVIVVSLVYGATRHETIPGILVNAYHAATWIVSFMAVIFGILLVISWWV